MEEIQEFPKMLYKHPADPKKEHTFITVNNCDEQDEAIGNGYQEKPHVPVVEDGNGIEVKPPTDNPEVVPHEAESSKDVLEDEHMNDKPDGEKIEE